MNRLIPLLLHIFSLFAGNSSFANSLSVQDKVPSDSLSHFIQYKSNTIALVNASYYDGLGNPLKRGQTILIEDGHFKAIAPDDQLKIPANAHIIDCQGKTLIPGLVGMHNHMHIPGQAFLGEEGTRLYLASGITTIQTCGAASPMNEIQLARAIEQGEAIGPTLIPSAPYFTGPGGNPNMIIPRNEQHLRDTVQHWLDQGMRWFKVYRNTRPEDLAVLTEMVHKAGGKVRGHLCSITFGEATERGIDGIDHGFNSLTDFRQGKEAGQCGGDRSYIDSLAIDDPKVITLQKQMIDSKVFLCSTLSVYEGSISHRAQADERSLQAMAPWLKEQYENRKQRMGTVPNPQRERRLDRIMAFEKQYHDLGGLLTAGVDAGRHVMPGYGDQRNYELLIEAGFSPAEALQIMTSNGAIVLEDPTIGSIQAGKQADFVILEGSLKNNPAVIQQAETVFKAGMGYDAGLLIKSVEAKVGL